MRKTLFGGVFTVLITLLSTAVITAQSTCSLLVERALSEVDTNCTGIERNQACYGYNLVRAQFQNAVADDFFSTPSDVTSIIELQTIATSPLDEASNTWGVAVMNVQANLPDTLPGQNVTFILLGDTEVENAVQPDEIVTAATVQVVSNDFVTVRSGPGDDFNALAGFAQGSNFIANGISTDGQWVKVQHENREGWIRRDRLQANPELDTLSAQQAQTRTPMQAVYLRTGIGQPICQEAPDDILLIQGPEEFEIELTVNGANFRVGSTVSFRLLEENLMEVFVIDGTVEVLDEDKNPTGVVIQTGQRSTACLSEPDSRGLDGESNDRVVECDFSPPEWVALDEIGTDWCMLQNVPANLLSYPVDLYCPGELLPTPVPPPTATPLPPRPVVIVPPVNITAVVTEQVTEEVTTISCPDFRILGPFEGITPRNHVFSWTSVPNATDYEIVFYDYTGAFTQSFFTPNTSIELNVGQIPTGNELSYEVRAFSDGNYLCVTPRTGTITRLPDPEPPEQFPFAATLDSCTPLPNGYEAHISWRNAAADDTIVATATSVIFNYNEMARGSGDMGTLVLSTMDYMGMGNIKVQNDAGDLVTLASCP